VPGPGKYDPKENVIHLNIKIYIKARG